MFEEELVADNFAGGGGASTGIEMARRRILQSNPLFSDIRIV